MTMPTNEARPGVLINLSGGAGDWTNAEFDRMADFAQTLPGNAVMTVTGPDGQKWEFRKVADHIVVPDDDYTIARFVAHDDDEEYWHNRCHATFFDRNDEMGVPPLKILHSFSHDEFGARIYGDPDTRRTFVFWTDWVANDWYQEVADEAAGHKYLAALATAVDEGRGLTAEEEATAGMA